LRKKRLEKLKRFLKKNDERWNESLQHENDEKVHDEEMEKQGPK